jgi:hypothetical protein
MLLGREEGKDSGGGVGRGYQCVCVFLILWRIGEEATSEKTSSTAHRHTHSVISLIPSHLSHSFTILANFSQLTHLRLTDIRLNHRRSLISAQFSHLTHPLHLAQLHTRPIAHKS